MSQSESPAVMPLAGNPTVSESEQNGGEHSEENQPIHLGEPDGDLHAENLRGTPQPVEPEEFAGKTAGGAKDGSGVKAKVTVPAKQATKANGAPTTPTVKKIISSGTFGSGTVKPTGTKASAAASSESKVNAPALKKVSTSAPSATAKAPISAKTPVTTARRVSVAPAKTGVPPTTNALSASANARPTLQNATGTTRNAVVSPTGSAGSTRAPVTSTISRPRGSISEAAKRAPVSSKAEIKPQTTLSKARVSVTPAAKPRIGSGLKDIKEDAGKDVKVKSEELSLLQVRLDEATKSLEDKTNTVTDLQERISVLEKSLTTTTSELDAKTSSLSELQAEKSGVDSQLADGQAVLAKTLAELADLKGALEDVQAKLEQAEGAAESHNQMVRSLQSQIQELEATVVSSQDEIESLKKTNAVASEAATLEGDSLRKAQADLKLITEEAAALKEAQETSTRKYQSEIAGLKANADALESLRSQISILKTEKDENATKLSELEVEILELKETQENLEDAKEALQKRISGLEDELARAAVAAGQAAEAANQMELQHEEKLKEVISKHEQDLEAEARRYADISASLEGLKAQYEDTVARHEQAKQEIVKKDESHATQLRELEKAHTDIQVSLSEQIEGVTRELNDQESIYNAKVDAVKAEHVQLLQEAFERAKKEAAQMHAQELQALRSGSSSTMEQIQEANRVALEDVKAEHASVLESAVGGLQKQIQKVSLELKATQDDLAKAKSALESARTEIESLTKQRDEARAEAQAIPTLSPEHAEEIARLTSELSNAKDDLAATKDSLTLTQSSMSELSDKRARELEEAATARADEVLKLRAAHDAQISELATQKSELLIKLSDLEGDLSTARSSLAAFETASPKTNGSGAPHPSEVGVSKDELTKLHEAHNLKIHDLHAEHEKALKAAKDELEEALNKIGELNQDIARKAMEIQYLEQDQDESQDQITRLKEDINTLTEKLQGAA